MNKQGRLDPTDWALLEMLQEDADTSLEDLAAGLLARKLPLSSSNISTRRKKLKEQGYIHVRAIPDRTRIGLALTRFILVKIYNETGQLGRAVGKFEEEIRISFPQVIVSSKLEGDWDFLLKVVATDTVDYERTHQRLMDLHTVANTSSISVFGEFTALIPIRHAKAGYEP